MQTQYRERWELEIRQHKGPLKKPVDLLRRSASAEDFLDSAVIGGVSIADVLAGKVIESQIPHNVLDAFHAQYPQLHVGFVEEIHRLASNPERLMGLVNGVKGKLFEIEYADWLNHGHLAAGQAAELAHSATNPAWDIAIHDGHGSIDQLLQVKATASIPYIHEAIAANPNIDVVVPHELYNHVSDHADIFSHIVDGHDSLQHINEHVAHAVGHAEWASAVAHSAPIIGPALVIVLAVKQNYTRYRTGRIPLDEAIRNVIERGSLTVLASAAGWAAIALTGEPVTALIASPIRLFGGQFLHNRRRREEMLGYVRNVRSSRRLLEEQLQRKLLASPA